MCDKPKNCENCSWCMQNKEAILPNSENDGPKEPDDYFTKLLMAILVLGGRLEWNVDEGDSL